jgi:hypothetical protein
MSRSGPPAMPVRYRTFVRRSKVIQAAHAAVLVAIISAFLPTPAQAQPVVIFDGPSTFTVNNPCLAGELVIVDGRQTITAYTRFDGTFGTHVTLRFIFKGKGSALTSPLQPAKEYVFNSESVFEMNAPSNGTTEETTVLNHILIRKSEADGTGDLLFGTGEDFMMKQTAHLTAHNGVPTANIMNGHTTCM